MAKLAHPFADVRVRNTFIDIAEEDDELIQSCRARAIQSCPGSQVGKLLDLFSKSACEDQGRFPEHKSASSTSVHNTQSVRSKPKLLLAEALAVPTASVPAIPQTPEAWGYPSQVLLQYQQGYAACTSSSLATEVLAPSAAPASAWSLQNKVANNGLLEMAAPPLPPPAAAAPGSQELLSQGSVGHFTGECKPCAFFHTKGCDSGAMCPFCHLCDAGAKKRRQKEKRAAFRGGA
eukprot:TRINITY_DN5326_c0_g1_i2.p1 TRINITY_DN5326_c0_g1~~TRINITY_DN5326_c0_g1_i2.p1  ORF type:complete len:266 (-),score=56.42 TRINITY_DN5326_c0_g1_i2:227-928(-)